MRHTNGILIALVNKGIISSEHFGNGLETVKLAFQDEINESSEKEEMGELFDYLFGRLEHEK